MPPVEPRDVENQDVPVPATPTESVVQDAPEEVPVSNPEPTETAVQDSPGAEPTESEIDVQDALPVDSSDGDESAGNTPLEENAVDESTDEDPVTE